MAKKNGNKMIVNNKVLIEKLRKAFKESISELPENELRKEIEGIIEQFVVDPDKLEFKSSMLEIEDIKIIYNNKMGEFSSDVTNAVMSNLQAQQQRACEEFSKMLVEMARQLEVEPKTLAKFFTTD